MSFIWWDIAEGALFGLALIANWQFRIWSRMETVASQLSSDKTRTALRTAFYAGAGALILVVFALEDIAKQNAPGTPIPVMIGLLIGIAFIAATLKTAGESSSQDRSQ